MAVVVGMERETPSARTLRLHVPELRAPAAGQHVDVRLTAEDGYTAQRSYSLSSPAGADPIAITVERFDDGEVSPYLVDDLTVGDAIEVRGPIGGWLVWRPGATAPVQLIGGGSGVAPLISMLRTRAMQPDGPPFRLLYAATDPDRMYFRGDLLRFELGQHPDIEVDLRFSRRARPGDPPPGRLTRETLAELVLPPEAHPEVYVCGPTGFVEAVSEHLVALGHSPERLRTERFGPTG